jgi:hypothetical protein
VSALLARPGLPPGRTREDALALAVARRKLLWAPDGDWMRASEDQRIDALREYCTRIYRGDRKAGEALATDAIWS